MFQPAMRELRLSKDVVFDERSSWYNEVNEDVGDESKEQVVAQKISQQQSQTLSGQRESTSQEYVDIPWSGRLHCKGTPPSMPHVSQKGKEKVDESLCMPNVSSGYLHVDAHSDGSEQMALCRALMRSLVF